MRTLVKKIAKRKFSVGIAALLLVAAGYFGYQKFFGGEGETRYVTAAAKRGELAVSITGTGQVSASNQLDIKPKVSGEVVYIAPFEGKDVGAGTLLAQLDTRDAQKAVRDAEVNLESAKLALEKLRGPEGSAVPRNKKNAEDDLKKAYDDGFTAVANAFLDLPAAITGLKEVLFGTDIASAQNNMNYYADTVKNYDMRSLDYKDSADRNYQKARSSYDKNFDDYRMTARESGRDAIEALIDETYGATIDLSDAVKSANNLIQFYKDRLVERELKPNSFADAHLTKLDSYTDKTNTHIAVLLNIRNQIKNYKDAVLNADLDVKTQELTVKQRENALLDAKEKLSDYYIRAPFAGVVAKIHFKKGDEVSTSLVAASLITRRKIAEISLNEVDVAGVKTGQKAALTFDAAPGLSVAGEVTSVDSLGTVEQGVVTYTVKIAFESEDERVKPAMSVSAAIVTNKKDGALLVPNSAVKQEGRVSYVEIMLEGAEAPERRIVETGLSNDNFTEIISELQEGEFVVTRTITSGAQETGTQQQQNSGLRIPGLPGQGSGGVRIQR